MPPQSEHSSSSSSSSKATKAVVAGADNMDHVDFEWSYTEEPHASRRKAILKAHPEVRALYGVDHMLKYKVLFAISIQIFMCWIISDLSWPWVLLLAYCVGGVINHSMTLGMHEISHNLAFRLPNTNRWFGMIANLPLGIPSSISFRRYHMEHHQYQGEDGIDADIPTPLEGKIFTNAPLKFFWVILQPAFYALRPVIALPKTPTLWEGANWIVQLSFDYLIYHFFGLRAVIYLVIGTLLGMGVHPMAGHFIAEHYTFLKGQETYSYYGPLNWFSFNVGYHNEHHDFPYMPGSRLPKLREIAPEFYDPLPHHASWVNVIWRYIVDPHVSPYSRIKRNTLSAETLADIKAQSRNANEKCSSD